MLETDYLDDPKRPGAVMGPKTVPRKTFKALENNILSDEQAYSIHTRILIPFIVISIKFRLFSSDFSSHSEFSLHCLHQASITCLS